MRKEKNQEKQNKQNKTKSKNVNRRKEVEKRHVVSEAEEQKLRKRTSLVFYFIIAILIFAIISATTDYIRFRNNKKPVFAIGLRINKENMVREYLGLGYKVVKFNNFETNDMLFGSWFLNYKDPAQENEEYNKRKDVNVFKLQILEDLSKITKDRKDIPKDPNKYIKENIDLYNQVKERENTYIYALELILHGETASTFDKYILAKILDDKNDKISFKFKNANEFIEQYEKYLSTLNLDELEETDVDKIAYNIILGNPELK